MGHGVSAPVAPVVAEAARVEDKARRRRSGDYLRRRWGWRADRAGYVLVTQEQALGPLPDGRFKPLGSWKTTKVFRVDAVDVKRRVGDVRDDQPASTQTGERPTQAAEAVTPEHQDLRFLPASVRLGLVNAVPHPDFEGVLAQQWSNENQVLRHTVSVLRHDGARAVVVQASRQHGAQVWQVEQVTYSLPPGTSPASRVTGPAVRGEVGRP